MTWPVETIDAVAQVNPRLAAADRPDLDELVCFVPMAAVSEETASIRAQAVRPFSEVARGYTPFKHGDVLVAKITPSFENGKMALADNLAHEWGFGTTEFHVFRPSERITGSYLFNLLRAPYVRKAGAMKMQGAAGQRRVPAGFFAALQVPLPPLAEQKRIAGILDAADTLRIRRREALTQLHTLLQSVFLDMFGDPIANPKEWDAPPLADFCKTGSGGTPSRKEMLRYYEGGTIPWVKSGELKEQVISSTSEHITQAALKETSVKLVPKDALLLALYGATVGRLGILGTQAATNQAVCHIIPDPSRADFRYMFHCLSSQFPIL